jgi:hypothetical protein
MSRIVISTDSQDHIASYGDVVARGTHACQAMSAVLYFDSHERAVRRLPLIVEMSHLFWRLLEICFVLNQVGITVWISESHAPTYTSLIRTKIKSLVVIVEH